MTGRLAAATASCLALLGGLWLVLAPFALGIQPSGHDWTDETTTDVATGLAIVAVGLIGVVAFAAATRQRLLDSGAIAPRHRQHREARPEPAQQDTGDSELSALLAPLVAALTQDVTREQGAANGVHSTETSGRAQGR